MSFKVKGKIKSKTKVENIKTKKGDFKKQTFAIDNGDKYNPLMSFEVFGDEKVDGLTAFKVGDNVEVFFNASSREYEGRWYSKLSAWKIDASNGESTESDDNDDLPF